MRKLMWFAVGFACACLMIVYLLPETLMLWAAGLGAAAFAASALLCLYRRRSGAYGPGSPATALAARRAFCAVLGLGFGFLWCWSYGLLVIRPAHEAAGSYEAASAAVCEYSEPTSYGCSVTAYAETPAGRIKTRLYLAGWNSGLKPGDVISGSFRLRPSDQNTDGTRYLDAQAKGILLTGTGTVSAVDRPDRVPLGALPQIASHTLQQLLSRAVPQDAVGFLRALVTGDRDGLSEADRETLSVAGVSHVIAVSGMHVGLLMSLLLLLMGNGGWLRTSIKAAVAISFALVTGASASVLRATVMLLILLPAPALRRPYDAPTALGAAALLLLLQNPWASANVSFQLSFCAVAGLFLAEEPIRLRLRRLSFVQAALKWSGPSGKSEIFEKALRRLVRTAVEFFVGCTAVNLAVLLFTTPITALVFHSFSLYVLLSNLLVLPVVLPCFAGGLICLAAGALWLPLGRVVGWIIAWPVRWVFLVCHLISGLPFARFPAHTPYGVGVLLAIYCVILIFAVQTRQSQKTGQPKPRLRRVVLELILLLAIACGFTALSRQDPSFCVTAVDVGQGQCLVLRAEDFCAVVDCGGTRGEQAGGEAVDYLQKRGIETVNVLVLTHYDTDHISGAKELMEHETVLALFLPDVDFDPARRAWVEEAAAGCGVPVYYVIHDHTLRFSGGSLEIFAPVSNYNDNAASLSVLFSAGEYDMLATGDMDVVAEYDLLRTHTLPKVEIYVAGHHGSNDSSGTELLEQIRPKAVLISTGRENRYGHPAPEALARFEQIGAEVFRTDQLGDIEIGR